MRVLLIVISMLFNLNIQASEDKEMQQLFTKYFSVMEEHKVELVDDVFSKKFLVDAGGKDEFIKGIKELPKKTSKDLTSPTVSFKKGVKNEMYFARLKAKAKKSQGPEFIIIKEDGKLKIQGTLSDGD